MKLEAFQQYTGKGGGSKELNKLKERGLKFATQLKKGGQLCLLIPNLRFAPPPLEINNDRSSIYL